MRRFTANKENPAEDTVKKDREGCPSEGYSYACGHGVRGYCVKNMR